LTEKLITELKDKIGKLVLVPSDGGRFEVSLNGKLIYSKLETGRFPEYQEIRKQIIAPRASP
jgi:selenoprotein W-related protein